MPFSFITDHIKNTDDYIKWMQPGQSTAQKSRLISNLGLNSDLIEISLETSSLMFFKQSHALRMIRSIFPIQGNEELKESLNFDHEDDASKAVIGFKLGKKTEDVQGIQIYLTKIVQDNGEEEDDEEESD